jgi:hypothetical protein
MAATNYVSEPSLNDEEFPEQQSNSRLLKKDFCNRSTIKVTINLVN